MNANRDQYSINEWVRKILFIGMGISTVLFCTGAIMNYIPMYYKLSGLFMKLGAAALLLTPVVRLISTSSLMLKQKDRKYGILCIGLIFLMVLGLFIGRFKI